MSRHKLKTSERGGGFMARCLDCDAITFGGFPSRTDARRALAGHDLSTADPISDLGTADPIEKAPGAAPTATEGKHTEAPTKGHEVTTNSMPDTTDKSEAQA